MKISIRSASPAVTRTLTDLVQAAGHEVSKDDAALAIDDPYHPASGNDDTNTIALNAPVRPALLAHDIGLKLMASAQQSVVLNGGWQLAPHTRQLIHSDMSPIALTEKECLLLAALARTPKAVEREALLKEVWSYDEGAETHTLETHIYRLRAKLNALHPKPCDIVTVEGSYRLVKE